MKAMIAIALIELKHDLRTYTIYTVGNAHQTQPRSRTN
jgi:hypothetical protein